MDRAREHGLPFLFHRQATGAATTLLPLRRQRGLITRPVTAFWRRGWARGASPQSAVIRLDRDEAMRLLASVDHGRVVFTRAALPASVQSISVVDGRVIRRTRPGVRCGAIRRRRRVVVAYEADDLDPRRRTGWSG